MIRNCECACVVVRGGGDCECVCGCEVGGGEGAKGGGRRDLRVLLGFGVLSGGDALW